MAQILITLDSQTYTVEELKSFIKDFSLANGWTEKVNIAGQPDLIDNPVDSITFAADPIRKFFRETLVAYNGNKASEKARKAASEQTNGALNNINLTIGVQA